MYPDLGKLDSTPDQDLGLTIAWKTLVNAAIPGDPDLPASPEAYLVARVQDLLTNYATQHVTSVQDARLVEKVIEDRQDAAAKLAVDLTVDVP